MESGNADSVAIGIDSEQNARIEQIGTIRAHKSGGTELFVGIIAQNGSDVQAPDQLGAVSASYARQTSGDLLAFQPRYYTRGGKSGGKPSDTVNLTAQTGDSQPHVVAFETFGGSKRKDRPNGGFYAREADTTKPLDTSGLVPNCAQGGMLPFGVRRLTPTECRRLQDFPDYWNDGQSDTAAYKQLGNAVCVSVIEWIGHQLLEVLNATA